MQIIALTGSIASGKSTIRAMCQHMGIPAIDMDQIAHALLVPGPGGKAMQQVASQFPEAATKRGVDRQRLGELVFADPKKLKQLETILHPYIKQEVGRWLTIQRRLGRKQVVVEVPLLFETGMHRDYHHTITTTASLPCIKGRALARPGMTESKLRTILGRQWPQAKKQAHADGVVVTGLGKGKARQDLMQAISEQG